MRLVQTILRSSVTSRSQLSWTTCALIFCLLKRGGIRVAHLHT